MSKSIHIDDPNIFVDEQDLYQFLLDLQELYDIIDLTELLQFFLDNEREDYYLTVRRFIANELK